MFEPRYTDKILKFDFKLCRETCPTKKTNVPNNQFHLRLSKTCLITISDKQIKILVDFECECLCGYGFLFRADNDRLLEIRSHIRIEIRTQNKQGLSPKNEKDKILRC